MDSSLHVCVAVHRSASHLCSRSSKCTTVPFSKAYIQYDTPFHLGCLLEGGDFGPWTNGCCDNGRSLQMKRRPIGQEHRDGRVVERSMWGGPVTKPDTSVLTLSWYRWVGPYWHSFHLWILCTAWSIYSSCWNLVNSSSPCVPRSENYGGTDLIIYIIRSSVFYTECTDIQRNYCCSYSFN